jgi:predicted thioesterase
MSIYVNKVFDAARADYDPVMANITVGLSGEMRILVSNENAVDFLGMEEARVLGTPYLIMYMEMTSRNTVRDLLEPGHDTVGTHVDVRHLAAAPLGMPVRITAEVIGVEDRRIRFRVEAFDEKEKLGEGTHERAIIHIARFASRVQGKLAG